MSDSGFMKGDYDSATAVPFSDDDTEKKPDELLEDDPPTATPQERLTRAQRRQDRIRQILEEGKAHAEKVKELEERDQKRERELAEMRGALDATRAAIQRPANDNQGDPYQERLNAIYARQAEAYNAAQAEIAANKFTPERQRHYEGIAQQIETDKMAVHTERAIARDRHERRNEQAQQVWVQKYPEVYNNPRAFKYAQAKYQMRTEGLGEQSTNALVDEIMQETITQFKLGPKAAPTANDRARLSGIPAAGGGGGKGAPAGIDFTRDPALKRIAIAAYPDLPEAEAMKKWTNKTGKKLREKKVL